MPSFFHLTYGFKVICAGACIKPLFPFIAKYYSIAIKSIWPAVVQTSHWGNSVFQVKVPSSRFLLCGFASPKTVCRCTRSLWLQMPVDQCPQLSGLSGCSVALPTSLRTRQPAAFHCCSLVHMHLFCSLNSDPCLYLTSPACGHLCALKSLSHTFHLYSLLTPYLLSIQACMGHSM